MYTTTDMSDQNTIADHAHVQRHPDDASAREKALHDAVVQFPQEEWEGYAPAAVELTESDAWIKIHAAGETEESALDHAESFGAHRDDVIVRMPGTHPGGPYIWLSIGERVYGPGMVPSE